MAITQEYLKKEIKNKKDEIERLQEEIKILQKTKRELTKYEKTPIEERTLIYFFDRTSKTVDLLDKFELLTPQGFQRYARLVDKGVFDYSDEIGYQFIIERLNGRTSKGDITMTEYKTYDNYALIKFAEEQIVAYLEANDNEIDDKTEVLFDIPYLLRAQNSRNRTGYGNYYEGAELVHEGTWYGETTNYAFVGVILRV